MKLGVEPMQMPGSKTKTGRHDPAARAFTLVEVVCAAAIAAILFLALFYGISQGYNILQTSRENLRATQIMVGRTEGLRLVSWTQLTNTTLVPNTFTDSFYPVGIGGFASNSVTYNGTMAISSFPFSSSSPDYAGAMKQVAVTVTWNTTHANLLGDTTVSHSKTFTTYVAENGVQNYVFSPPISP